MGPQAISGYYAYIHSPTLLSLEYFSLGNLPKPTGAIHPNRAVRPCCYGAAQLY